ESTAKQWTKLLPSLPLAINAAVSGKNKIEQLVMLGVEINESFKLFRAEKEFTSQELEALKEIGRYLRTDSEPALAKIIRLASLSENPWVIQELRPKAINQRSLEPELRKIVKLMTGRAGTLLTS